jgi:ABC-type Mn2+/Zn2+ transport system permease subunit
MVLIAAWFALAFQTAVVIAERGLDLLPVLFGDIAAVKWPSQFNADFLCLLGLWAIWTSWRNSFTPSGLALAAVAFVGGAGFLLPYLLVLSVQCRGDVAAMLMCPARAGEQSPLLNY